jgi:hypothetical protein
VFFIPLISIVSISLIAWWSYDILMWWNDILISLESDYLIPPPTATPSVLLEVYGPWDDNVKLFIYLCIFPRIISFRKFSSGI